MENDEEMTRKIALHCMKSASELKSELCEECPIYGQTGCDHCFEDALQYVIRMLEQEPCEDTISRKALIERINHAEENFKADHMESIGSDDGDPFVDGVLSGVFNVREMVMQVPSATPQPMIEIDLDYVIKQKYIEREVLDKIRVRIEEIETYDGLYIDRAYVLQIIDKYKAESEDKDA